MGMMLIGISHAYFFKVSFWVNEVESSSQVRSTPVRCYVYTACAIALNKKKRLRPT